MTAKSSAFGPVRMNIAGPMAGSIDSFPSSSATPTGLRSSQSGSTPEHIQQRDESTFPRHPTPRCSSGHCRRSPPKSFTGSTTSTRRTSELSHDRTPWIACESTDFDFDSRNELIVESAAASFYVSPDRGGSLFEWDVRAPAHNLVSVLTRRPEAYHEAVRAAAGASAT